MHEAHKPLPLDCSVRISLESQERNKIDLAIDERKVFILPSGGQSGTEMLAVRHQSQEHAQ